MTCQHDSDLSFGIFSYGEVRCLIESSAIAQAVSRWLPTAAVRGSKPDLVIWDFVVDKGGAEAGFLRVLRFLLPNSFHQLLQKIFIIIIIIINQSSGICTIGQMGKRLWPQYKGLMDA
jgi:hypothetical protein